MVDLETMHCVSAGLGSHCPGVSVCSVSVQVLVVGPEGMSPSSHWKVAIAPTVVPDTVVPELGGNSGASQTTVWVKLLLNKLCEQWPPVHTILIANSTI